MDVLEKMLPSSKESLVGEFPLVSINLPESLNTIQTPKTTQERTLKVRSQSHQEDHNSRLIAKQVLFSLFNCNEKISIFLSLYSDQVYYDVVRKEQETIITQEYMIRLEAYFT